MRLHSPVIALMAGGGTGRMRPRSAGVSSTVLFFLAAWQVRRTVRSGTSLWNDWSGSRAVFSFSSYVFREKISDSIQQLRGPMYCSRFPTGCGGPSIWSLPGHKCGVGLLGSELALLSPSPQCHASAEPRKCTAFGVKGHRARSQPCTSIV